MKFLIVFVSTILAAKAAPHIVALQPTVYTSLPVWSAVPAVSQYHAQDALGQYSYGYSGGPSAKSEVKTLDGVTRGTYSYIDSNAQLQTVNYVADSLGFRVAATNLPQQVVDNNEAPVDNAQPPRQVEDTPAVQQARSEHLAAVALARSQSSDSGSELEAPEPVEDTEEVKQAREEHLQAVEEAKARNAAADNGEEPSQPQVVQLPAAVHLAHGPVAYINAIPHAGFAYSVLVPGHHVIAA